MMLGLLASCSSETTSAVNMLSAGDEEAVRQLLTTSLRKAYDEQDTTLLNQLLHTDFKLIDDNGDTFSKQDELDYATNYGPSYSESAIEVKQLSLFENGTALATSKATLKGRNKQSTYITTYTSSYALIKVSGRWKVVNNHVSGVKEEVFPDAPN